MKRTILTIPNFITTIRLLLALSLPFFKDYPPVLLIMALVFVFSDFEGVLARKLNQVTVFGAVLDKCADLVFVTISFLFFFGGSTFNYVMVGLLLLSRLVKNLVIRTNLKGSKQLLFSKLTYLPANIVIFLRFLGFDVVFTLKWIALLFWIDTIICIFHRKK